MLTLKQAIANALNQNDTHLTQLTAVIKAQTKLLSQLNYPDAYNSQVKTHPSLLDGIGTEPQLIDIPVAEFFVNDNFVECAKLFDILRGIEINLNQHNITIAITIRKLAAAIVGEEYIDEMLEIGFIPCMRIRKEQVAINKIAYYQQVELAKAANIYSHGGNSVKKDESVPLMKQLIEQGANPQEIIEEDWLNRYGALKTGHRDIYFKSATAAVVWSNNLDGLKLLLTHEKTKNKIDLFKLLDQVVVHYYNQGQQSRVVEDKTDANALLQFDIILAHENMTACKAIQLFDALLQKHTQIVMNQKYYDQYIHLKLSILLKAIFKRFGYDVGSFPEFASVKTFMDGMENPRYDVLGHFPPTRTFLTWRHTNTVFYIYDQAHQTLLQSYVTYCEEFANRKLSDPTLITPMIAYLDENQSPLSFLYHHLSLEKFLKDLFLFRKHCRFISSPARLVNCEMIDNRMKVAAPLNTILYYLSGTSIFNNENHLNQLFQELVAEDDGTVEKFFRGLMVKMLTEPSFKLAKTKWDKLVDGYTKALGDKNPKLADDLKAFNPNIQAQLSPNLKVKNKDNIHDEWVELFKDNNNVAQNSSSSSSTSVSSSATPLAPTFFSPEAPPVKSYEAVRPPQDNEHMIQQLGQMRVAGDDDDNEEDVANGSTVTKDAEKKASFAQ